MPLKNLLHVSFFGVFKRPQTWTRAHRQCADPEGDRESGTPWKKQSSTGFYSKKQLGPITLEKVEVGPSEYLNPLPPHFLEKNIVSLK